MESEVIKVNLDRKNLWLFIWNC